MNQKKLKVIVYSDYICPFCYIGFHRIEKLKLKYNLEIEWEPFELHPETPEEGFKMEGISIPRDYLEMVITNVRMLAEEDGLDIKFTGTLPNSQLALYISEFARKKGKFDEFHKLVLDSYWKEGKDIGNQDILLSIAESIGFDGSEILEYIKSGEPFEMLKDSLKELRKYGINGVPTFIIGDRIVVGAQPYEVFEKVIINALESDLVI